MKRLFSKFLLRFFLAMNLLMAFSLNAHASSEGFFPNTRAKIKTILRTDESSVGKKIYSGIKRTARIATAPIVGVRRGIKESFYSVPTFSGPMIVYNPIRGGIYGIWAAGKTVISGGLMPKSIRPGFSESFESTK